MRSLEYLISPEQEGMSVQSFLKRQHGYSTRTIIKLKQTENGLVLDGRHVRTIDPLKAGSVLRVTFCEPEKQLLTSRVAVALLWEDEDILIYNKPPFMPVHTSCGHASDTLENVYAAYCARKGLPCRLRALNRLDRDTSGCVLLCKNQFVASRLTGHFEKRYRALVCGRVKGDGRVDGRIFRPDPVDMRRTVDERGQVAITEYGVLCQNERVSYLQFHLLTGRTHQIRVHMASIGHPVVGDQMYATPSNAIDRQALHCHSLSFTHPITGEKIAVTAPLPADMQAALAALLEGDKPCAY